MRTNQNINAEFLRGLAAQLMYDEPDHISDIDPGLKHLSVELIDALRKAMWPQIFGDSTTADVNTEIVVTGNLERASRILLSILGSIGVDEPSSATACFLSGLPAIKRVLATDVAAAYEGDPAARNEQEIVLAYPAFEAITIYRIAHRLYEMNIPFLPRMMTEYAHRLTGIDIHPGATIGSYFFMDHGTGVVIGETTTIGHHVKLYQGVTLGAKSFPLDENGNPIKGLKRHPDIGNNVVIYAGATILGGDTHIGDNAVIGGNVWLTHSIEAGQQVVAAQERSEK